MGRKNALISKKAIIVGAASGIGRELAKIMSDHGYTLGITDVKSLESLAKELGDNHFFQTMDLVNSEQAMQLLKP